MKKEDKNYRIIRMQAGPYADGDCVWGVLDSKLREITYTSYSLLLVEDECNRLNGFRTKAQCAS